MKRKSMLDEMARPRDLCRNREGRKTQMSKKVWEKGHGGSERAGVRKRISPTVKGKRGARA